MFLLTNWTDTLICQTVIREKKIEGSQCSHWLQNYLLSCRKNSLHSSVWSVAANGKLRCKQNFPWQLSTYETSNSGKDWKPRRSQQFLTYEGSQSRVLPFPFSGNRSLKLCWDLVVTNWLPSYPKSYTQSSMLFSTPFANPFLLLLSSWWVWLYCHFDYRLLHPKVPDGLSCTHAGLLPRSNLQRPKDQLFANVCTRDTLWNPPPHSSTKPPAPQGLAASDRLKNSCLYSPEVHSCQAAACSSVISGPTYWKPVILYIYIYIGQSYSGSIRAQRWHGWSSPIPADAGFQQCGQLARGELGPLPAPRTKSAQTRERQGADAQLPEGFAIDISTLCAKV